MKGHEVNAVMIVGNKTMVAMTPPDHRPSCTEPILKEPDLCCVGCVWANAVENLLFLYTENQKVADERKRRENYGKN